MKLIFKGDGSRGRLLALAEFAGARQGYTGYKASNDRARGPRADERSFHGRHR